MMRFALFPHGLRAEFIAAALVLPLSAGSAETLASSQGAHSGHGPAGAADYEIATPPLWPASGTLTMPVATTSAEAQRYFDQGMRFAYGFNHAEARRSFREAQRLDPSCAMCFWGEALALGPNINYPMPPEAVAPAVAALKQAQKLAGSASPKEQALIGALAARYVDDPAADRASLDQAYAELMAAVAGRYPDDPNIAVLAAEAAMDTQPWDYWEPNGSQPKGRMGEGIRLLEGVLAKDPENMAAIHLYIHAVEASDDPHRAEPYADRMARQELGSLGHLVHMPSHIYYRIGRYGDSIDRNRLAAAADEEFIARTGATGYYPALYYPHNVHFIMASAQLVGDGPTALSAAEKLLRIVPDDAARAAPMVQAIKSSSYSAYAQYAEPDDVLKLAEPPKDLTLPRTMWHYARGVALAASKDLNGARSEAEAIREIDETADFSVMKQHMVPGAEVVDIARNVLLARIAQGEGNLDRAVAYLKDAAALQDELPYMEPPYWYYPVRRSLGAALLQAGRAAEAEAEFRAALERAPRSPLALYGLAESLEAKGDQKASQDARAQATQAWRGDAELLRLDRL